MIRSSNLAILIQSIRGRFNQLIEHPLLAVGLILAAVLLSGTVGYMVIERWSVLDALYMTVITFTTIGFGEVRPLSPAGRVFTIGIILFGVAGASIAVTSVVGLFTSEEFVEQIRRRRRRSRLEQISNHAIICGFGRLGRNLTRELQARDYPVIVIDLNSEKIEDCHRLNIPAVQGNAADEQLLHEAGLDRARAIVAAADSDAENVFIVLTARSMKPDLQIIARCNAETTIPKLETAGANTVISPYATTGLRIAQMLIHPNVLSFLDGVLQFGDHEMRLEEIIISPNSSLAGLSLREAKLKVAVLAITHPEETRLAHATADARLRPGGAIIAMGIDQELKKAVQLLNG